jgi:hypothetical protein
MSDECPHDETVETRADGWQLCACGVWIIPRGPEVRLTARGPVAWSQALEDFIVAAVKDGARPTTAARAYGVSREVMAKWMTSRAEPFVSFRERVEDAAADARMRAEQALALTDKKFWLSKMDSEWGDAPKKVELSGRVDSMVANIDAGELARVSLDELKAQRARLLAETVSAEVDDDAGE